MVAHEGIVEVSHGGELELELGFGFLSEEVGVDRVRLKGVLVGGFGSNPEGPESGLNGRKDFCMAYLSPAQKQV